MLYLHFGHFSKYKLKGTEEREKESPKCQRLSKPHLQFVKEAAC